jgi:hypothetical protein
MEHIQQTVLDVLERDGSIPDSRRLPLPDANDNPATLQAALSSLRSKDVRLPSSQ